MSTISSSSSDNFEKNKRYEDGIKMKKIIVLSGYSNCGKETVCDEIINSHTKNNIQRIGVLDSVKRHVSNYYSFPIEYCQTKDDKEKQFYSVEEDIIPGGLLMDDKQYVEEMIYRKHVLHKYAPPTVNDIITKNEKQFLETDKNSLIDKVIDEINESDQKTFIIPDIRFKHQIDRLKSYFLNVRVVYIHRFEENKTGDNTEYELDNYPFDNIIMNTGTLDDLKIIVKDLELHKRIPFVIFDIGVLLDWMTPFLEWIVNKNIPTLTSRPYNLQLDDFFDMENINYIKNLNVNEEDKKTLCENEFKKTILNDFHKSKTSTYLEETAFSEKLKQYIGRRRMIVINEIPKVNKQIVKKVRLLKLKEYFGNIFHEIINLDHGDYNDVSRRITLNRYPKDTLYFCENYHNAEAGHNAGMDAKLVKNRDAVSFDVINCNF